MVPSNAVLVIQTRMDRIHESPPVSAYFDEHLSKRLRVVFGSGASDIERQLTIYAAVDFMDMHWSSISKKEVTTSQPIVEPIRVYVSRRQLDQQAIARAILGNFKINKLKGRDFYVADTRGDGSRTMGQPTVHFPDDRTVMLGSFEGLTSSVWKLSDGETAEARQMLEEYSPQADLVVIFCPRVMQAFVNRQLKLNPLLPEYAFARAAIDDLQTAVLETHLTPQCRTKLVMTPTQTVTPEKYANTLDLLAPILLGWLDNFGKSLDDALPATDGQNVLSAYSKFAVAVRSARREIDETSVVLLIDGDGQLSVLDAVFVPKLLAANAQQKRLQEAQPMKELAIGAMMETTVQRKFITAIRDKASKSLLSWRVALLPYIEESSLYNKFHRDEPWDSPHNKQFIEQMPAIFRTPNAQKTGYTTVCLVVGHGSLYTADNDLPEKVIEGGRSKPAILIVRGGPDVATPWRKPDSFPYDPKNPRAVFNNTFDSDWLVMLNSHDIAWIPSSIREEQRVNLFAGQSSESIPLAPTLAWPDIERYFWSSIYNPSKEKMQRIVENLTEKGQFIAPAIYDSGGQPLLSWRVHILPNLGYGELYEKFDLTQAWDSPHNKPLIEQIPDIYRRPGRTTRDGKSNYVLPVGSETLFHPGEPGPTEQELRKGDQFVSTITLLEVDDEAAVPWTKPEDLSYNAATPRNHLTGNYPVGFIIALPNHSPVLIPPWIDENFVRAIFTWDGHEPIDLGDVEHELP